MEQEYSREDWELLHLHGFHEVDWLEGHVQRGRAVDHLVEKDDEFVPKTYTVAEALELIRAEKQ